MALIKVSLVLCTILFETTYKLIFLINQASNYTQNGQCALYRNTVSAGYQISSQGYTYPTIDLCISWCSNMSMNYAVLFTWYFINLFKSIIYAIITFDFFCVVLLGAIAV